MNRSQSDEILFLSAYSTKEVAEVCLNCTRPAPNCGEGCYEYRMMVREMTNKSKGQAGGRKAFRHRAYGIEFTYPQLAVAVGFTSGAVRARMEKLGGDAEKLVRSFNIFTAVDLESALNGGDAHG